MQSVLFQECVHSDGVGGRGSGESMTNEEFEIGRPCRIPYFRRRLKPDCNLHFARCPLGTILRLRESSHALVPPIHGNADSTNRLRSAFSANASTLTCLDLAEKRPLSRTSVRFNSITVCRWPSTGKATQRLSARPSKQSNVFSVFFLEWPSDPVHRVHASSQAMMIFSTPH